MSDTPKCDSCGDDLYASYTHVGQWFCANQGCSNYGVFVDFPDPDKELLEEKKNETIGS